MRAKHKKPIGPSAKPIPKVISFKIRSRSRSATARRLTASSLAIPPRQRQELVSERRDGRFKSGIWEAQPGKWRVVFTEERVLPSSGGCCHRRHRR